MRAVLIVLALALPVEGLRTKTTVAEWSGLGGIPEEAANVMNALVSGKTTVAEKHMESMKARISSFTQEHPEEQARLGKAVKAMFPLTAENRKQIEAMKVEHPEIGQALMEMKAKQTNPATDAAAAVQNLANAVPAGGINSFGMFTGLNPNSGINTGVSGLCYFFNIDFLPCLTFNVCMGAVTGLAASNPNWWAKSPITALAIPFNMARSSTFLRINAPFCDAMNVLVAPHMPPLNGMLWNLAPKK